MTINGQFAGNYEYGCFPDCFPGGGCVIPPIGQMIDTGDETFRVPVNLNAPVSVVVQYFDYDACNSDDPVGGVNLVFDPLWASSSPATIASRPAMCRPPTGASASTRLALPSRPTTSISRLSLKSAPLGAPTTSTKALVRTSSAEISSRPSVASTTVRIVA